MKFLLMATLCAFFLLSGCLFYRPQATQGQALDTSHLQAIHPHDTTYDQVVAMLGDPILDGDASRACYVFATIDPNHVFTLITSFTIFFDKNGVVAATVVAPPVQSRR